LPHIQTVKKKIFQDVVIVPSSTPFVEDPWFRNPKSFVESRITMCQDLQQLVKEGRVVVFDQVYTGLLQSSIDMRL